MPLYLDNLVVAVPSSQSPVVRPRSIKRVLCSVINEAVRHSNIHRKPLNRYESDMFTLKSQFVLQLVNNILRYVFMFNVSLENTRMSFLNGRSML